GGDGAAARGNRRDHRTGGQSHRRARRRKPDLGRLAARPDGGVPRWGGCGCGPGEMGVTLGLGASLIVGRVAASQIWGVSPHDPMTLSTVVAVMVLVGLAACYVPARRATRVDPMIALRCE